MGGDWHRGHLPGRSGTRRRNEWLCLCRGSRRHGLPGLGVARVNPGMVMVVVLIGKAKVVGCRYRLLSRRPRVIGRGWSRASGHWGGWHCGRRYCWADYLYFLWFSLRGLSDRTSSPTVRGGDGLVYCLPGIIVVGVPSEIRRWHAIVVDHIGPVTDSTALTFGSHLEFHVHSLDNVHAVFTSGTFSERLEIVVTSGRVVQLVSGIGLGSEQRGSVESSWAPRSPHDALLADDLGFGRDNGCWARAPLPLVCGLLLHRV